MMQPKVQVRMLSTGQVRALSPRDAKLMVAAKKAVFVGGPVSRDEPPVIVQAEQTYQTRHLEPAPEAKRRGRPPKAQSVD